MKLCLQTIIDLPMRPSDTIRMPAHESPAVAEAIRVTSEVHARATARAKVIGRRSR